MTVSVAEHPHDGVTEEVWSPIALALIIVLLILVIILALLLMMGRKKEPEAIEAIPPPPETAPEPVEYAMPEETEENISEKEV